MLRYCVFLAGLLALTPVSAAETDSKRFSGEIAFELQDDWNYAAEDRSNLNNNLFATIEPSATFRIAPGWSIFAHAVLEPVGSASKFENRSFEDTGLYLEDFYAEYAGERLGAKAGKLNPGFGIAWDNTPGVYGTDLAEDYEISERISIVADWLLTSGANGAHKVSAATFFADTSIFSESALRNRGDNRKRDGGVGNTESFESFLVALNGGKIPGLGDFGYHVSYMRQAAGQGDATDEHSFAVAFYTSLPLGGGVAFDPIVEVVRQNDQGGVENRARTYMTLGGQLSWKGWNVATSVTERETDNPATPDNGDTHFQVSAGYAFEFGLSIDVGWKISEDAGSETRTLGAVAAYTIEF